MSGGVAAEGFPLPVSPYRRRARSGVLIRLHRAGIGRGFAPATSVNLAGNVTAPVARSTITRPVVEGLAKSLEHVSTKLVHLVQEEHSLMQNGSR